MVIKRIVNTMKKLAAVFNQTHTDVVLNSFIDVDFKRMDKPAVVVYKNLAEYPGKIVGRLFDGKHNCNVVLLTNYMIDMNYEMQLAGLKFAERKEDDGATIVGTWYKEEKLCS